MVTVTGEDDGDWVVNLTGGWIWWTVWLVKLTDEDENGEWVVNMNSEQDGEWVVNMMVSMTGDDGEKKMKLTEQVVNMTGEYDWTWRYKSSPSTRYELHHLRNEITDAHQLEPLKERNEPIRLNRFYYTLTLPTRPRNEHKRIGRQSVGKWLRRADVGPIIRTRIKRLTLRLVKFNSRKQREVIIKFRPRDTNGWGRQFTRSKPINKFWQICETWLTLPRLESIEEPTTNGGMMKLRKKNVNMKLLAEN